MMPTPLLLSRRITSKSTRTSAASSEEVGSSITTSDGLQRDGARQGHHLLQARR